MTNQTCNLVTLAGYTLIFNWAQAHTGRYLSPCLYLRLWWMKYYRYIVLSREVSTEYHNLLSLCCYIVVTCADQYLMHHYYYTQ